VLAVVDTVMNFIFIEGCGKHLHSDYLPKAYTAPFSYIENFMIKFPFNEVSILSNKRNGENSNIIDILLGIKGGSIVACFLGLLV
jgi:hypothetical protein